VLLLMAAMAATAPVLEKMMTQGRQERPWGLIMAAVAMEAAVTVVMAMMALVVMAKATAGKRRQRQLLLELQL
jgi:hypothetical protein